MKLIEEKLEADEIAQLKQEYGDYLKVTVDLEREKRKVFKNS
jgi:hypothetical protein